MDSDNIDILLLNVIDNIRGVVNKILTNGVNFLGIGVKYRDNEGQFNKNGGAASPEAAYTFHGYQKCQYSKSMKIKKILKTKALGLRSYCRIHLKVGYQNYCKH